MICNLKIKKGNFTHNLKLKATIHRKSDVILVSTVHYKVHTYIVQLSNIMYLYLYGYIHSEGTPTVR